MEKGDRAKYSDSALRNDRDRYLKQGQPEIRASYKKYYEAKKDLRGTIVEILENGCVVNWDNNTQSRLLLYMIDII